MKNRFARALGRVKSTGLGVLLATLFLLPSRIFAQRDSSDAFGDSIPISNGLMGKIYILPDTTQHLPIFDLLKPLSNFIYTKSKDVSPRSWSAGFPGLCNRFEWFGIEYTGTFRAVKAGKYAFRLLSDDGSKLYVDGKLVVNNDGLHGTSNEDAKLELDKSVHTIKLDYFRFHPPRAVTTPAVSLVDRDPGVHPAAVPGHFPDLEEKEKRQGSRKVVRICLIQTGCSRIAFLSRL